MKKIKILIEKHPDGYVAYPVGVKGVVVVQGDTYEEALQDVQSALKFHIETFGSDVLEGKSWANTRNTNDAILQFEAKPDKAIWANLRD